MVVDDVSTAGVTIREVAPAIMLSTSEIYNDLGGTLQEATAA